MGGWHRSRGKRYPPPRAVEVQQPEASSKSEEPAQLSVEQADQVHVVRSTIAALEGTIETLTHQGMLRGVQRMEADLQKQRRRERELVR